MWTRKKIYNYLTHIYMFSSVVATVFVFALVYELTLIFYTVGASSPYIAFGVFTAATTGQVETVIALAWGCFFPIALIVSYFLTFKKHYVPFCVVVALDCVAVAVWVTYAFFTENSYGFELFIPDLIISCIYSILLICFIPRKTGDGSLS